MASKKNKRPSSRPRRTAIVPRVVFSTLVAVSVVPAAGVLAGCGQATTPQDAGMFAVAIPNDAGRDVGFFSVVDAGFFSVVAIPDAGPDAGTFAVAVPLDGGFSVAAPQDSGFFGVALPDPDSGFFGVAAPAPDSGVFGVALPAPFDAS